MSVKIGRNDPCCVAVEESIRHAISHLMKRLKSIVMQAVLCQPMI